MMPRERESEKAKETEREREEEVRWHGERIWLMFSHGFVDQRSKFNARALNE